MLEQFAQSLQANYRQTVAAFLELQVRGSAGSHQVLASLTAALRGHGDADPRALAAGLTQLRDSDLRPLARGITTPALVIAGQHDRVTPPAAAAALVQLLPQAQSLLLARAAHAPFLSHLAAVTHAILESVRAVQRADGTGA